MRQEILEYVQGLNLGEFIVTTELPWNENGVPLYLKNPKKVYVSRDDVDSDDIIQTLSGLTLNIETTTVSLIFSSDAKTTNPGYEGAVTQLRTAKNITTIGGVLTRTLAISTEFEGDLQVTTMDITFTKLQ